MDIEELVDTHYKRIFAYCRSILIRRDWAEDACHDVFLKVQRNIERYDPHRNGAAWLLRIARNHCYDLLRKERRSVPCPGLDHLPSRCTRDPEEIYIEREQMSDAIDAVNRLSTGYREVFVLREINRYSYREIGALLGIETGRVKWMLHKARLRVRGELGGVDDDS